MAKISVALLECVMNDAPLEIWSTIIVSFFAHIVRRPVATKLTVVTQFLLTGCKLEYFLWDHQKQIVKLQNSQV